MKNMFNIRQTNRAQRQEYKLNIEIPRSNQVSFSTISLCIQGTKIRKSFPLYIKSRVGVQAFKDVIKLWDGSEYSCDICFDSSI